MPLSPVTLQPVEFFPACIKVNVRRGAVLNAVGLSGPGAEALFKRRVWERWRRPFLISFAAAGATREERLKEWEEFARLAKGYAGQFASPAGLEMNFFCPNTGVHDMPVVDEIRETLDIAAELNIPLVVKINVFVSPEGALRIEAHPACDALCQSNTILFGELVDTINWQKLWGKRGSPLARFGGGGLSGPELFPLVLVWIREARKVGLRKPIVACGGIFSCKDADMMIDAGADAIQLGSVSIVRPWRVKKIIAHANSYARAKRPYQYRHAKV